MVLKIRCVIDTRKLNRGLVLAARFTKRTPAQAVNTAACEVAIGAKNGMPFVTAQTIDTELLVMSVPKIGKSGRVLQQFTKKGKSVAKNKILYGTRMGKYAATSEVPLTALIIAARAKPGSNYNRITGGRYALDRNPFKGFSRALGQFKMTTLIDNMIKARHRSGHFLMAGWIQCVKTLLPFSVNKGRDRMRGPPLEGRTEYYGADLGDALPAMEGGTMALCIITNNIGGAGKNAFSFNQALWEHGQLPLQRAVDGEGAAQLQYFLDRAAKEELYDVVNAEWK